MDMSMSMPGMASPTSMSMILNTPMSSTTSVTAMAAATGMSMGGHDGMNMGAEEGCRISMLWNWYTIDACFLSPGWRIRSSGAFAASMIGVVLLVIILEGLRRAAKEYDQHVINSWKKSMAYSSSSKNVRSTSNDSSPTITGSSTKSEMDRTLLRTNTRGGEKAMFRPSLVQQSIRAMLHMLQFAVAYTIMLLAMYYNGYLIICIFVGAYLGFFVFGWESVAVDLSPAEEATLCCG